MTRLLAALLLLALPALAQAQDCRRLGVEGETYAICTALAGEDLRLLLTAPDGQPVGHFARLREMLAAEGKDLGFAMNAGMYHPDRRPVGLFLAEGAQAGKLVTARSKGNFGMLPNGVFCIGADGFRVVETLAFRKAAPACRYATQSGPMLVIEGQLHPRFAPDATSRYVRNGVGVSADGRTAFFAISERPVTFHRFARLFRDALKVPNALYLDGNVSRLYAPDLDRQDPGLSMGPIVALVRPRG
jgi:uncharacterized protein YigE (DUF2233 family)